MLLKILAAVGLILPQLTGLLPWLTPLAAVALVLTMVGAAMLHAKRKESAMIMMNMMMLLMTAFVAYGRFVLVPA